MIVIGKENTGVKKMENDVDLYYCQNCGIYSPDAGNCMGCGRDLPLITFVPKDNKARLYKIGFWLFLIANILNSPLMP